uniref:PGG domain-containing protein n=1 Tax=Oryza glumipatula TaxID=40148 RepID=A0A0E0BGC1_9ORYZ
MQWNAGLSGEADASGSTALHFAASADGPKIDIENSSLLRWLLLPCPFQCRRTPTELLLETDPSLACQPDGDGDYPIHVAASAGNLRLVALLLDKCPECAGLRDARGRTFLHVAVDRRRQEVVGFASDVDGRGFPAAAILNARDDDGNTALHLAVVAGVLRVFWCLFRNRKNARTWILWCLTIANALSGGNIRRDHFLQRHVPKLDESAESKKMTESAQVLGVGSVLVATVAFAVAFSPPGGYVAAGAPALAGRYDFDAFMYAVALAFTCSMLATLSLMYAGTAAVEMNIRHRYFKNSVWWMRLSMRSLLVAFALGVYLVLAPVSRATAAGVCALAAGTMLFRNRELVLMLSCAHVVRRRMGIRVVFRIGAPIGIDLLISNIVYLIIFGAPFCTPLCVLVLFWRVAPTEE